MIHSLIAFLLLSLYYLFTFIFILIYGLILVIETPLVKFTREDMKKHFYNFIDLYRQLNKVKVL